MGAGSESSQEAFDRGHREGGVEARLAEHEKHLRTINGSIDRGVDGLAEVKSELQQLASDVKAGLETTNATAKAAAATVVATAQALKEAEEARRDKSTQTWSPFQKFLAVAAVVVAAVVGGVAVYANLHR